MKWSSFVYKVDMGNHVRIKSSKNLVGVELEKSIYCEINKVFKNNSSTQLKKHIDELIKLGLITEDFEEEKMEFFSDMSEAVNYINDEITITIIPTLKCNFCCVYCYENGIERKKNINVETINVIFEWIHDYLIQELNVKKIHFKLFGGEPLFIKDEILIYLFNKIDALEIKYTTGIITNGYFLTQNKCDIFFGRNMDYLQVTLDGPQKYHDSKRILKNGNPTFDVILNNLSCAIKMNISKVYIIRVNCCKSNISIIPELLIYISERFCEYKHKIMFSFGLLGKSFDSSVNKQIDDDYLKIDDGSLDKYIMLYKQVIDIGFISVDHYELSSLCSNKITDSIIIQSDGNIIKCLRGVGREDFYESNIENIILPEREFEKDLYEKCFDEHCPYIPFCHLGCQHGYFVETTKKKGRNCQRMIIEYINEKLLKNLN